MPALLTLTDFTPHQNAAFRVRLDAETFLDLELITARPLTQARGPSGEGREPFSLIFRGPFQPGLKQKIYEIEHPALGLLEIFLVPVGSEGDQLGTHYEALFN